jgi:hypothetical protein
VPPQPSDRLVLPISDANNRTGCCKPSYCLGLSFGKSAVIGFQFESIEFAGVHNVDVRNAGKHALAFILLTLLAEFFMDAAIHAMPGNETGHATLIEFLNDVLLNFRFSQDKFRSRECPGFSGYPRCLVGRAPGLAAERFLDFRNTR